MISTYPSFSVVSAEIVPVRMPFTLRVTHSLAARSYSDNVMLRLVSSDGTVGYGECVPRHYVTGETVESVIAGLERTRTLLHGVTFSSPDDIRDRIGRLEFSAELGRAALCCVDLALVDLAGRLWGVPASHLVAGDPQYEELTYSLVVPLLSGPSLTTFMEMTRPMGFRFIKVKVDGDDPLARIRFIRSIVGDGPEIRVDVNCAWSRDEAHRYMRGLAELGVVSVEQPLPADDLEGLASLREPDLPPVVLDEAVSSLENLSECARAGAGDIVNIRVSKCGGLYGAMAVRDEAERLGYGTQLGAQVGESCLLSAAGAHLASLSPGMRWLEGCFGTHLLATDICEDEFRFGDRGRIDVPVEPGLGVTVSDARLDEAGQVYANAVGGVVEG